MTRYAMAITAALVILAPENVFKDNFPRPEKIISLYTSPDCIDSECYVQIDKELDKYYDLNSDKALAELAVLHDFSTDAGLSELIYDITTRKGERMAHFLYIKMITESSCKKEERKCRSEEYRKKYMQEVLNYLREGILPMGPECYDKKIMEYDKKVLNLALDTYKKDKGTYPDSLSSLQKYFEERYRSLVRIHNPCGGPYEYKKLEDGKYSIE